MKFIKTYAKAVVALLLLAVAGLASALGVDTGINPAEQLNVIVTSLVVAAGVWAVPNQEEH